MDKLEFIFDEELTHITMEKIESKICYDISGYLDDVDLCCIITQNQSKSCVQLLEIYWQLYQCHVTFDCDKWKKLRLLFSKSWNDNNNDQFMTIKDIIASNSIYKGYINDYYIPTINGNKLIKPKLLYDINGNSLIDNNNNNDIDTNTMG